jgi:hypothetical protein
MNTRRKGSSGLVYYMFTNCDVSDVVQRGIQADIITPREGCKCSTGDLLRKKRLQPSTLNHHLNELISSAYRNPRVIEIPQAMSLRVDYLAA